LALERLTVAQAAAQLGVSQDAIRKRIRRNTIDYDQDPDGRIYVYVDLWSGSYRCNTTTLSSYVEN
jgi:IS30 family transposase